MTGTPRPRRLLGNKTKSHNDQINQLWARGGRSPGNSPARTFRGQGKSGGAQATTISTDDFANKNGDTWMGAQGERVDTRIIDDNQIDIAPDDTVDLQRSLPTALLQPESGVTDNLVTISNAKVMQQQLWVRGVNSTVTITLIDRASSQTAWALSQSLSLGDLRSHGGFVYSCKQAHTSTASDEPGVGANWEDYWYKSNIITPDGNDFDIVGKLYYRLVYDISDEAWHVTTGHSGGSGGSGLSEPVLLTINSVTPQTEPTTTDIDCSLGNFFKISSLDRDVTMAFTNETASKEQTVHIVIIQDGTGGHTVTWPSEVKKSPIDSSQPGVSETASDKTDVVLYTDDAGTNWYWTVSSSGGSGGVTALSGLTIDTDFDANGTYKFIGDADGDTYLIASTDDRWEIFTAGTEKVRIDTQLQLQGGVNFDANGNDIILDVDNDTYIHSNGDNDLEIFVGGGNRLNILSTEAEFGTSVEVKLNDELRWETGITAGATNAYFMYRNTDATNSLVVNVASNADFILHRDGTEAANFSVGELQLTHTGSMDIDLYRNDGTPTDDDELGVIKFQGNNSAASQRFFATLVGVAKDVTSLTEDGAFIMRLIQDGTEKDMFQFRSDGSASTPVIELFEDDASPANGDVGQIQFYGRDSANNKQLFAEITAQIDDVTSTSEDGALQFRTTVGGSMNTIIEISGLGGSQKLGFFGTTPVVQQTVASDTLANLYTALRASGIIG